MEKHEINTAIAVIMGFSAPKGTWMFGGRPVKIPDYSGDLNVMREAEGTMWPMTDKCDDPWNVYLGELEAVSGHGGCSDQQQVFRMINAPAADRAEAFLRVHGKWEEGE